MNPSCHCTYHRFLASKCIPAILRQFLSRSLETTKKLIWCSSVLCWLSFDSQLSWDLFYFRRWVKDIPWICFNLSSQSWKFQHTVLCCKQKNCSRTSCGFRLVSDAKIESFHLDYLLLFHSIVSNVFQYKTTAHHIPVECTLIITSSSLSERDAEKRKKGSRGNWDWNPCLGTRLFDPHLTPPPRLSHYHPRRTP